MLLLCFACKDNLTIYWSESLEEPRGSIAKKRRAESGKVCENDAGKYNPSLELAFAIADCFGEPIEKIFLYHEDAAVNRKESCGGRTCGVSAAQGGGTR